MIKDTHISPDINHGRKRDTDVGFKLDDNWGFKKDGETWNKDGDPQNIFKDFEGI